MKARTRGGAKRTIARVGHADTDSFNAAKKLRETSTPPVVAPGQTTAQYFADDLRGRNVSDSLNAFLSGVADSDELRRVLERQAASQGCGVDGVRVKRQTICPALSDLRIWGFDTEDFAPFNASFNMEAYSQYLLGVGYDNVMQCYSLRSQVPAISKLETMALMAKNAQQPAFPYQPMRPGQLQSIRQPPLGR